MKHTTERCLPLRVCVTTQHGGERLTNRRFDGGNKADREHEHDKRGNEHRGPWQLTWQATDCRGRIARFQIDQRWGRPAKAHPCALEVVQPSGRRAHRMGVESTARCRHHARDGGANDSATDAEERADDRSGYRGYRAADDLDGRELQLLARYLRRVGVRHIPLVSPLPN